MMGHSASCAVYDPVPGWCDCGERERQVHLGCERQIAQLREELNLLENKVNARDAELWGRTQEILSLREEVQRLSENSARYQKAKEMFEDGTIPIDTGLWDVVIDDTIRKGGA